MFRRILNSLVHAKNKLMAQTSRFITKQRNLRITCVFYLGHKLEGRPCCVQTSETILTLVVPVLITAHEMHMRVSIAESFSALAERDLHSNIPMIA